MTQSQIANMDVKQSLSVSRKVKGTHGPLCPKLLIHGDKGMGQNFIGPALLYVLEEYPIFSIDLPSILGGTQDAYHHNEALFKLIKRARDNAPSVIYWPRILSWWESVDEKTQNSIMELIQDTPNDVNIYILATSEVKRDKLNQKLKTLFPSNFSFEIQPIAKESLNKFWSQVLIENITKKDKDISEANKKVGEIDKDQ
eukprot:UN28746